ncbi:hypothetical protein AB674_17440 [Flavobacterium sp. ABG]|nr:hypothetical protein AB674_17440 [Flavobacterium sp. ABG]
MRNFVLYNLPLKSLFYHLFELSYKKEPQKSVYFFFEINIQSTKEFIYICTRNGSTAFFGVVD